MNYLIRFCTFLTAISLAACSGFGDKEVDLSAPAELQKFERGLEVDRLWSRDLGEGPGDIHPPLVPAIDGDTLYAADRSGRVTAIDLTSGKVLWRERLKDVVLTGGTGAAHGLVLIGTDDGEVIALSQTDGSELWRARVTSEVLAAPATNGNVVVVPSLDGRLHGLEADTGAKRWMADSTMPLLTVRGNAAPLIVEDFSLSNTVLDVALVGQDNGKVKAYAVDDGVALWEARVGVPEGRTDLERMVDIDGQPLYHNGTVYAVSFQGGLMAVDPRSGQAVWYQEASSNVGPAAYAGTLVITEVDGTVRAFNASVGTEFWTSDEYANRQPNQPIVTNNYVAFADFEGYLHLLSRRTGETIGREKVDGSGVRAPTLLYKDQLIVLDNSGGISAYSVTELD